MILLLDNYDSFTYNIYQMAGTLNPDIQVIRNDILSPEEILQLNPERIILSPGPGHPKDAGILTDLIQILPLSIPLLGICLGHQALALSLGGTIRQADQPVHGKTCQIQMDPSCRLFAGIDSPLTVGRYHSLIVDRPSLPPEFAVVAEGPHRLIMGIAHQNRPLYGLQFHPESILSEQGLLMFRNFLSL